MQGLVVDNFAGGGGASTGIEAALGRSIDVAINHDAEAVALHAVNHPDTLHLCQNVWKADPREVVRQASAKRCGDLGIPFREMPVDLAWFSPDCKHFSKAKGSKPVEKGIRDLAWVVIHWARLVKPSVIMLENVEEFRDWGPLIEASAGRLVPCPLNKGLTFKRWCRELKKLGYKVDHRALKACDYGTPTIRKRLYVIARRDGLPITWPEVTHAKVATPTLKRFGWAADCIDWSLDCPSIFTRRKELAENTLKRIARGVMRFVVNAAEPFIVPRYGEREGQPPRTSSVMAPFNTITPDANVGSLAVPFVAGVGGRMGQSPERGIDQPFQTFTAKADAALVTPFFVGAGGPSYSGKPVAVERPFGALTTENHRALVQPFVARIGQTGGGGKYVNGIDEPVTTITSKAEHLLIAPHVTKFRTGSDGHRADEPLHTVTANSFKKRPGGAAPLGAVAAFLAQHNTDMVGHDPRKPLSTIVGKGCTQSPVEVSLSDDDLAGAERVAAFLVKYYGASQHGQPLAEPLHAATSKPRFGLVTVLGLPIVDIGMRMLQPRELYRAQGFPEGYVVERDADGKPFTKTAQVRMVGNSVCPPVAEALVRANLGNVADIGERAAD